MTAAANNLPGNMSQQVKGNLTLADAGNIADLFTSLKGAGTQDAVTASTTQTQAGGKAITAAMTNVSSANANDAVTFPQALPGRYLFLVNSSGNTINAFPAVGDALNAAGANNSVSIATATTSVYVCILKGQWWGGAITNES